MLYDFHTHTTFSDGKNTPEEMVQRALELGVEMLGFSDHSYLSFDERYCIQKDQIDAYFSEVQRLREKYRGQIRLFAGVEQDYDSTQDFSRYDYVIGSAHFVNTPNGPQAVDESPECSLEMVRSCYGGDPLRMAEEYYEKVSRIVEKTQCDLIGHFDLVAIYNESLHFFDPADERYIRLWKHAADRLLETGVPFELNTGCIFRGKRSDSYPCREMRDYIAARGGRFVLSSDSHRAAGLCTHFEDYADYPHGPLMTEKMRRSEGS